MIRLELLLQTEYVLRFQETNSQLPGCEMLACQIAFCVPIFRGFIEDYNNEGEVGLTTLCQKRWQKMVA